MRRVAILLVLLILVVGGLIVSGIISVRVDVRPPTGADARPFWQEQRGDGRLPAPLGVWVEVARAVTPAVVNISTTQRERARDPFGEEFFRRFFEGPTTPQPRTSLGSGVVISPDGYIVTNFHVVRQAAEIVVRLPDQREHRARLAGSDPRTDIALLKIEAANLPTIPFGDSDHLEVGAPVMAIGNPFGLDQTVTTGIVSAKERVIGAGPYDDFIQTDASINPGNSGGPLVDAQAALVGINTAIFSQTGGWMGIGFATPVNLVKDILVQLRDKGRVTRGYLGVAAAPVPTDGARAAGVTGRRGALVAEVVPGSPAAAAGLKIGDVITAFQGAEVQNPRDLTRRVAGTPPGTRATLEVMRGDARQTLTVSLGELREREIGGRR